MTNNYADTFITALRRLEDDGDLGPIVDLFARESVCDNATATEGFRGPEGAREFWDQDRKLFGDVHSEFRNVVEDDGRVVLEWKRTGTASTGDAVSFEGVSVLEVSDGKITRFKAYFDPSRVGRQIGAL